MDFTTELSSVNSMLGTIGEAPVNTLENTGLVDVTIARTALAEVQRAVLIEGWAFNTDEDYPLYPSAAAPNEIPIPASALSVLPAASHSHITPRGSRLYDRTRRSYSFTGLGPVPCKVVWHLDFGDIPEVTRQFITVRAGRLFQSRTTASDILHAFTEADERQALWAHQKNNVRARRKVFLTDSLSIASILAR